MRKQLVKTVLEVMEKDPRVVLFLGDIGVYSFREAFQRFPERTFNIGILEQASVSVAAGLAIEGLVPIFHTIAPFLVERAYEMLKIDFGYQQLGGNFISVGSSYDYSTLGATHHCPGDVQVLKAIPGMQIVVPGCSAEFDAAFKYMYDNDKPTYFRLSERENSSPQSNQAIKLGKLGSVIAIGPTRDRVIEACQNLDVTVIYHSSLEPFSDISLRLAPKKIVVVEPFYEGTMAYDIQRCVKGPIEILSIGVPRRFITSYGTVEELDGECGLTVSQIRDRIRAFLNI